MGSPLVTVCEGGALRMVHSPMSSMARHSRSQSIVLQQNDDNAEPAASQNQPYASAPAHAAAVQSSEEPTKQQVSDLDLTAKLKGIPEVMTSSREAANEGTGSHSAGNPRDAPPVVVESVGVTESLHTTSGSSGFADELEGRLNSLMMAECETPGALTEIADLAFRAAVGQLEGGEYVLSERCFQVALRACPASRTKAVIKIQTLLKHVQDQIQRTSE